MSWVPYHRDSEQGIVLPCASIPIDCFAADGESIAGYPAHISAVLSVIANTLTLSQVHVMQYIVPFPLLCSVWNPRFLWMYVL